MRRAFEGGSTMFADVVEIFVRYDLFGTPQGDELLELCYQHGADWMEVDGWCRGVSRSESCEESDGLPEPGEQLPHHAARAARQAQQRGELKGDQRGAGELPGASEAVERHRAAQQKRGLRAPAHWRSIGAGLNLELVT